ncbi:T9SS type A sorting domain-containing protein [Fluviicola sp.]|uniref:DUF7619 domain-containing protein n=1 Tax=Fluviicola sp. TaxID=1917219 RepID=UPI0031D8E731
MKTLLITILAFVSLQLNAQTWVQVPDPNFQNFLTAHYPAGAFMTSGGNFFVDADHADIQAEDTLFLNSMNLMSIEGVQAFENLVYLSCYDNQITGLPALPVNLDLLECSSNQLTSLPVLPMNLRLIYCSDNQLTSLPGLPNSLIGLNCGRNQLTALPALPGILIGLDCPNNQIAVIPGLPNGLTALNISSNPVNSFPTLPASLHSLICDSIQLTALPALPPTLTGLSCSGNMLTVLPALPGTLNLLVCYGNQLTSLPNLPATLYYLNCASNQLTSLPELPDGLQTLNCVGNNIHCFGEFPLSLTGVFIANNPFTCLPNYIPAMDPATLAYSLCIENDPVNNPNGCAAATGIEGTVFHDANSNCISTGQTLTYVPMSLFDSNGSLITSSTSLANGDYYFSAVPGTYALSIDTVNLTDVLQVTCPSGITSTATVPYADTVVSGGDFGLVCDGYDLGVQSITPNGWFFPGQVHTVEILAGDLTAPYNMHCASGISGEVSISVAGPGTVTFLGSPISVSGNIAVYAVADFGAPGAMEFFVSVLTDTTAQGGDEFCVSVAVSTTAAGELSSSNNGLSYCYEVVNSYDPNIKQTYPEIVEPGYDDEFTYTVYFQNTGNAPAFNIRLADTLDANLDLTTFKAVNASHEFNTVVNASTRLLTVRFPNIMLPDSASDPQGSIGFIQYRVKPLSGLPHGTTIHNTAYIYFDYNAPIVTNTTENLFTVGLGLNEFQAETIQLYPNPAENEFFVHAETEINQVTLSDINGKQVGIYFPNAKTASVNVSDLKQGIYLVTLKTNQSVTTKRLIVR